MIRFDASGMLTPLSSLQHRSRSGHYFPRWKGSSLSRIDARKDFGGWEMDLQQVAIWELGSDRDWLPQHRTCIYHEDHATRFAG